MKLVSSSDPINPNKVHVMLLNDAELAAVKLALYRFATESMRDIEAEQAARPEGPLWGNWRTAQGLDLQLRHTADG